MDYIFSWLNHMHAVGISRIFLLKIHIKIPLIYL
jgi:hypothetical protein